VVAELVGAATGLERSVEELILAGERGWNMKRLINMKLGLDPAGEVLPGLLREPLPEGGQEGHVPDIPAMLDEYYAASGWDRATGWPTAERLARLGLAEFAPRP
jgi:aldehyde:ferredoxin oxidoreductase